MFRRAGKFQKSKKDSHAPLPEDTGDALRQKWLLWAEDESVKRLVFHAFLFDAQVSMSLFVNPLISYAEINLSLPAPRDLWMAEDAELWKAAYMRRPTQPVGRRASLGRLLQQPSEMCSLPGAYDLQFSVLAVLHGLWAMIWEYNQQLVVLETRPGCSTAVMALRHQELRQQLDHARISMSELEEARSPEIILVIELLSMHLHVSLEKIQLFAGKEDLEEARGVLPSLQDWIDTPNSRRAIWHAGQILRAAKTFLPAQLRGFYAIAVYHASLTCWAYGLISQTKGSLRNSATHASEQLSVVWLDGTDTAEVQRFIALGRGRPSIGSTLENTSAGGLITLFDPEAVMNAVVAMLRSNFPSSLSGDDAPPLVENLVQLMRDLGRAGGSVSGVSTKTLVDSVAST